MYDCADFLVQGSCALRGPRWTGAPKEVHDFYVDAFFYAILILISAIYGRERSCRSRKGNKRYEKNQSSTDLKPPLCDAFHVTPPCAVEINRHSSCSGRRATSPAASKPVVLLLLIGAPSFFAVIPVSSRARNSPTKNFKENLVTLLSVGPNGYGGLVV